MKALSVFLTFFLTIRDGYAQELDKSCLESFEKIGMSEKAQQFCTKPMVAEKCVSHEERHIWHIDYLNPKNAKRSSRKILVFGTIHGDETLSSQMTISWMQRLQDPGLDPRNDWRFVPFLNPDGLVKNTRNNARGVDLNRNFPTKDWTSSAQNYWKKNTKSDPRRFPGENAASEPETRCAIAHLKDFKPDIVVSVHTPYEVLDFDGPKTDFPKYLDLPWKSLGNFPGSLGRYMWKDYRIPVLTVELGAELVKADRLQDTIGTLATRVTQSKSNSQIFDLL